MMELSVHGKMCLYCPLALLCRYSDLTLFTAAIRVNPNNGKLYSNLGHQYENRKNYSYAEHLFRRGTEIQPDDAGAFMNLGRALKAMDRLEEAEKVGMHMYVHNQTFMHCANTQMCGWFLFTVASR